MAQNNNKVFQEMIAARDLDLAKKRAIKQVVENMIQKNINIDSKLQVSKKVHKDKGYEVSI